MLHPLEEALLQLIKEDVFEDVVALVDLMGRKKAQSPSLLRVGEETGNTFLLYALEWNRLRIAEHLLHYAIDQSDHAYLQNIWAANKHGKTVLHFAAEKNYSSLAKTLLLHEYNTDPALSKEDKLRLAINQVDNQGCSPIFYAYKTNSCAIITLLRDKGAKLDIKSNQNQSILMMMAQIGNDKLMSELLYDFPDFKNNINEQDINGNTALHDACEGGHVDSVNVLLLNGADYAIKNLLGQTPLDLTIQKGIENERKTEPAKEKKYGEIIVGLSAYGALIGVRFSDPMSIDLYQLSLSDRVLQEAYVHLVLLGTAVGKKPFFILEQIEDNDQRLLERARVYLREQYLLPHPEADLAFILKEKQFAAIINRCQDLLSRKDKGDLLLPWQLEEIYKFYVQFTRIKSLKSELIRRFQEGYFSQVKSKIDSDGENNFLLRLPNELKEEIFKEENVAAQNLIQLDQPAFSAQRNFVIQVQKKLNMLLFKLRDPRYKLYNTKSWANTGCITFFAAGMVSILPLVFAGIFTSEYNEFQNLLKSDDQYDINNRDYYRDVIAFDVKAMAITYSIGGGLILLGLAPLIVAFFMFFRNIVLQIQLYHVCEPSIQRFLEDLVAIQNALPDNHFAYLPLGDLIRRINREKDPSDIAYVLDTEVSPLLKEILQDYNQHLPSLEHLGLFSRSNSIPLSVEQDNRIEVIEDKIELSEQEYHPIQHMEEVKENERQPFLAL